MPDVTAVQLWSSTEHTPDQNRTHAIEMAERAVRPDAAGRKPDCVVLPEAVAMLCYPDGRPAFTYHDVADPSPGPTSDAFCRIAGESGVNIVVGLIEDRGSDQHCQNTTLVIDRAGRIVGRYDKIHEPSICRTEQAAAVGSEIPVFDLDFGRIGIMVCWDLISPEIASILMLKGAELLLVPHLIGLPTVASWPVILKARAIDSGLPVVAAGMRDAHNHNGIQDGLGPTCIIGPSGEIIAQTDLAGADIVGATLDLSGAAPNRRKVVEIRGDRRPDVYAREYFSLT